MIRVQTPARLHFGLLSFPTSAHWTNEDGEAVIAARRFGGVGLMVNQPGISVTAQPARTWSASGPLAERALKCAQLIARGLDTEQAFQVHVETETLEHVGLGTGTQLGLAVARAVTRLQGLDLNAIEMAGRMERGVRSALGIHGFERGGFLVEAGRGERESIAPLVAWSQFPATWRIVLVMPASRKGLHGVREREVFRELDHAGVAIERTDALCRLVLLGMLPALAEGDFRAFCEALYDFNARVGESFAKYQESRYADRHTAELVLRLRQRGFHGVAQSSWGPTVAVMVEDEDRAGALARALRVDCEEHMVIVTKACNEGARLQTDSDDPGA